MTSGKQDSYGEEKAHTMSQSQDDNLLSSSSDDSSSPDDSTDDYALIDGVLVKLRGDGTVDDDDYVTVNGVPVQVRGDGSIDDDSVRGTDGDDEVIGSALSESIYGEAGDDLLKGKGDDDSLYGDDGDDTLKGGGGDDYVNGGTGSDLLAGGLGANIFDDCDDGFDDVIRIKSDQAFNGDNSNGQLTDLILDLDLTDALVIVGVGTDALTFSETSTTINGQTYTGLGVFANGTLEALVVDENLTVDQLAGITTGVI